jgi:hypothetical protein
MQISQCDGGTPVPVLVHSSAADQNKTRLCSWNGRAATVETVIAAPRRLNAAVKRRKIETC